jgi:hypothetical protein
MASMVQWLNTHLPPWCGPSSISGHLYSTNKFLMPIFHYILYWDALRSSYVAMDSGMGTQCSGLRINEPNKAGARKASARSAVKTHHIIY